MESLRVLIADDEPKIRKGMKNSIDWGSLGMEVAAEAGDGEIALEKALILRPDLLLVDICMPFLNGLELISRLRDALPDSLVIVVTGHDEFAYAQQAVRLNVFDYILKPIVHDQLCDVLRRAGDALATARRKREYLYWADRQLQKNMPFIRERFLNEWMDGCLSDVEIGEQLLFFGLDSSMATGMLLIKVRQAATAERERQLKLIAAQNIAEELLAPYCAIVFRDNKDHIIAIVTLPLAPVWQTLAETIGTVMEENLALHVHVIQSLVDGGRESIPFAYRALLLEIAREKHWTPMVALCKAYIDTHYASETLSLQDAGSALGVSPAYLSRLMRQELGASFIDYLIRVRIDKAVALLQDPLMKICDVAKMVGYNSQHYFSTAFKKRTGVSPAEYRREGQ